MKCPRILISGTSSSSGKTSVVCAVLTLLRRRAQDVKALKCGPDYLDPTFHEAVSGVPCSNLDPFFSDEDHLRHILSQNEGARLSVIEGVMGYYDGTGESGMENSTYSVARKTLSPVVLVVSAKGTSTSVLAIIEGFLDFVPDSMIKGVILNGTTAATYRNIRQKIQSRFGDRVVPVGYMPQLPEECLIPSRHLGLVSAQEIRDISHRIGLMADLCEDTIDLDALLSIADRAEGLEFKAPEIRRFPTVRIAVAKDRAFFFYYHDFIRLLVKMGAEICFFSPLADEPVPRGSHGLLLGGGYPELYAQQLEAGSIARKSVRDAVSSGIPTIAECGGFQYLGKSLDGRLMCGVLPHESFNCGKPVRFGYVTLTSKKDGLFGKAGTILHGHEYHYYDSTDTGCDFVAEKTDGRTWNCAVTTETLYAGYPHLYLPSSVAQVESFYLKCLLYREKKDRGSEA